MVCGRCQLVVRSELEKLGFHPVLVELGEVELLENLTIEDKQIIEKVLNSFGFELLEDRISKIIEQIKKSLIYLVHHCNESSKINLSDYLVDKLRHDYSFLSKLFSQEEGVTIEHYFILQKVEKIKELLKDGELSLKEISDRLNYSSVSHLSSQFKKITGFTITDFKKLKNSNRKKIDEV